jgi:hypothetical protein
VSLEATVTQYNETNDIGIPEKPKLPNETEATLCNERILRGLMALNEAFDTNDLVGIAEALTEIIYTTAQQAVTMGLPVDALIREAHRSHMGALGKPRVSQVLMARLDRDPTDFQGSIQ